MPCCWPRPRSPRRRRSRRPPRRRARAPSTRRCGSTSVPSGCGRGRGARARPVSASRIDDLAGLGRGVDAGDERHRAAQRAPSRCSSVSCCESHEAVALAPCCVGVEVLPGACGRRAAPRRPLPAPSVGSPSSLDPAARKRSLHLGVGAERERALLQQQVVGHVRRGRLPDAVSHPRCATACSRSGAARRSRPGPCSSRSTSANAWNRSPCPKTRSWSYLMPRWPFRSMWNSLPCHERLRDARRRSSGRSSAHARPRGSRRTGRGARASR